MVGRLFSGFADSQEINREVLQQHTACGHIPTMHLIDHDHGDHVSQHFLSFGGVSHVSRSSVSLSTWFCILVGSNITNYPIGSMYAIYGNIWGIFMVNVTIYSIHGSYGY